MLTLQRSTTFGGLGDFRSDFVGALSIAVGKPKAESIMAGFEDLVKTRAREGAEAAIPRIKTEVKATVQPLVIGAMAVSGVAAVLSILAIIAARKARRS